MRDKEHFLAETEAAISFNVEVGYVSDKI